jgi:hypothetical protein
MTIREEAVIKKASALYIQFGDKDKAILHLKEMQRELETIPGFMLPSLDMEGEYTLFTFWDEVAEQLFKL